MLKDPALASLISDDLYFQRAKGKLFEKYREIENTTIPQNFIELLDGNSKKNAQIKLLKKQTFTSEQLIAFLFCAFLE